VSFPTTPCRYCGVPVIIASCPSPGGPTQVTLDTQVHVFRLSDSQTLPVALAIPPAEETYAGHWCSSSKKVAVQTELL
jgi:hypothetical protein